MQRIPSQKILNKKYFYKNSDIILLYNLFYSLTSTKLPLLNAFQEHARLDYASFPQHVFYYNKLSILLHYQYVWPQLPSLLFWHLYLYAMFFLFQNIDQIDL